MGKSSALLLIAVGAVLLVIGVLAYFGALSWFGRLPGDIRIESDRTRVYIPLVSMLLVSLVLTLISWLVRRFL